MYLNLVSFLHFLRLSLESESQGLRTWWAAVSGVAQSRTRLKRLSNSSSRLRWKIESLKINWSTERHAYLDIICISGESNGK